MSASDYQIGGDHYKNVPKEMQVWNVIKYWLTPEEYRGWHKGVAIVYLARERNKGGDLDIQKAIHHLERLTEEFTQSGGSEPDGGWVAYSVVEAFIDPSGLYDVVLDNGCELSAMTGHFCAINDVAQIRPHQKSGVA